MACHKCGYYVEQYQGYQGYQGSYLVGGDGEERLLVLVDRVGVHHQRHRPMLRGNMYHWHLGLSGYQDYQGYYIHTSVFHMILLVDSTCDCKTRERERERNTDLGCD